MFDWILHHQLKILLLLGLICIPTVFIFDFRGLSALAEFLLSLILVFSGTKIYEENTSENWSKFSYTNIIKNIIGLILMFFGWRIFLEGVLALAIASVLSTFS